MGAELKKAQAARDAYKKAGAQFCAAAARLYPVGSLVEVTLGRARVTLRITGHSEWDPGAVHGENVETGKRREFTAGYNDAEIVS